MKKNHPNIPIKNKFFPQKISLSADPWIHDLL